MKATEEKFLDEVMTFAQEEGWVIAFIDPPEGVSAEEKDVEGIMVMRPDAANVVYDILKENGLNLSLMVKSKENDIQSKDKT